MQQLEGLGLSGVSAEPAPVATVFVTIQRGSGADERGNWTGFGFPVWKDEATTRAWREAHGKPKIVPKQGDEAEEQVGRANPAPFDGRLRECLSLKQGARDPFSLMIHTAAIGKDNE